VAARIPHSIRSAAYIYLGVLFRRAFALKPGASKRGARIRIASDQLAKPTPNPDTWLISEPRSSLILKPTTIDHSQILAQSPRIIKVLVAYRTP